MNEQLQYLYIQRVFAWESLEMLEEDLEPTPLNYYDNKKAVDQVLGKPSGVLSLIDEASKTGHGFQHVLGLYFVEFFPIQSLIIQFQIRWTKARKVHT